MGYADACCTFLPASFGPWLEALSDMVVPVATIAFLFYPVGLHLYVVYTGRSAARSLAPLDTRDRWGQKSQSFHSVDSKSLCGTSQTQLGRQSATFTEADSSNAKYMWDGVLESFFTSSCIPRRRTKSGSEDCMGTDPADAKGDWWGPADSHSAHGLEHAMELSRLLAMRVVRHGILSGPRAPPWHADKSMDIYRDMGMRNSSAMYVASWINLEKASFLFVSQVLDEERLRLCTGEDALMNRLKLVLRPVRAALPFPAKAVPEAETVGAFFGLEGSSFVEHCSDDGIKYVCFQVALYSKWQLRLAMQTVGFREGNILDMLIVDWPGMAVLASCQLTVTRDLLHLLE